MDESGVKWVMGRAGKTRASFTRDTGANPGALISITPKRQSPPLVLLEVNNGSEEMITSELKLGGDHLLDHLLAPIVYHT